MLLPACPVRTNGIRRIITTGATAAALTALRERRQRWYEDISIVNAGSMIQVIEAVWDL